MAEIKINASKRTNFGKGASRRDRKAGLVPAVIYGHNAEPQHVALPSRELATALKASNVLLNVSFDGKSALVLPKSVSKNPLTGIFEHIDLLIVRKGEKVTVEVPVHTDGQYDKDGILEHVNNTVQVEAEATSIPSFLILDLTGMLAGTSKTAADVQLPAGTSLISDPEMVVVHLSERSTAVEEVVAPVDTEVVAPVVAATKE
jgi:large subunit ribosomal protein L25